MPSRRRNSTEVRIVVTDNYSQELRDRLSEYKITQTELAAEMKMNLPQVNRWLNPDEDGEFMQPSFKNVMRIEQAIAAIRARRAKK